MINTIHKSPMSWEQRWEELGNWVLREMDRTNELPLPNDVKVLLFMDIYRTFLDVMKELEEK